MSEHRAAIDSTQNELEEEANLLLYGHRQVDEGVNDPEIFSVLGGGAPKREHLVYREPKRHPFYAGGTCVGCGRKRYEGGTGLCRLCYRSKAQAKFQERSPGIEWLMDRQDFVWEGGEKHIVDPINRDPLALLSEAEE